METIHGAELVLLSFPEQNEGEYVGGLLTIATPMGKNWHWLRAEEYVNVDDLLASALGYAKCVGLDHVKVVECQMVENIWWRATTGTTRTTRAWRAKLSWNRRARELSPAAVGNWDRGTLNH